MTLLFRHRLLECLFVLALTTLLQVSPIKAQPQQQQPSGCGICASTGDCSHAFKGTKGQFCGTFQSKLQQSITKPCCCPVQSTCKLSTHTCLCHLEDDDFTESNGYNSNYNSYHQPTEQERTWLGIAAFVTVAVLAICWIKRCGKKNTANVNEVKHSFMTSERYPGERSSIPVATAHEIDPLKPPPAMNPNYAATTNVTPMAPPSDYVTTPALGSPQYNPTGMGNWMAGFAGLATGAAVGAAATHQYDNNHPHHRNNNNFTDDPYGRSIGGGHDIAGDDGEGGGYDIAGDDGDGGY